VNEQLLVTKLNLIASEIKHEDDLLSARTTWLVISQSFLFGTFVAVIGLSGRAGKVAAVAKLLLVVIPLAGVLLPIVILLSRYAAASAIRQWRAQHDRLCATPRGKVSFGRGSSTRPVWWPSATCSRSRWPSSSRSPGSPS
jgi:hypothetical protein